MAQDAAITGEMKSLLNVEFGPVDYEVERGMLKKFVEAIEDPNPLWQSVAPPTFVAAMQIWEIIERIYKCESSLKRFINGGNQIEYYKPIKLGDKISVTCKMVNIQEREGKKGPMVVNTVERTFKNQDGEIVIKEYNTIIRF